MLKEAGIKCQKCEPMGHLKPAEEEKKRTMTVTPGLRRVGVSEDSPTPSGDQWSSVSCSASGIGPINRHQLSHG